jgi:hypothetical protein
MGCLEGSGVPVLYIGRTVPKGLILLWNVHLLIWTASPVIGRAILTDRRSVSHSVPFRMQSVSEANPEIIDNCL